MYVLENFQVGDGGGTKGSDTDFYICTLELLSGVSCRSLECLWIWGLKI